MIRQFTARIVKKLISITAPNIIGAITHVLTQDAVAALTFDDGPHLEVTPRLLKILERHQARATFFIIGKAAKDHPELVKQIAQAGHAIGNHSWDHPSFPYIKGRERRAQIRECAKIIAPYGQKLFRPPYLNQNLCSYIDTISLDYRVIAYDIDAQDWRDHDANWIVERVIRNIKPGSIILFHDSLHDTIEEKFYDREQTLKAVDLLLERLHGRFRFITIPELFKHGRPHRQYWFKKADIEFLNNLKIRDSEARRYT